VDFALDVLFKYNFQYIPLDRPLIDSGLDPEKLKMTLLYDILLAAAHSYYCSS
jgi:hypothetical protein